jgi:hypothetical protein
MKPAAGNIAAGSAILRKAGRFLPETPEGSNVFAFVSLTDGRKRQKFGRVNAPDAQTCQNPAKYRTMIRDFYHYRQKCEPLLFFRPILRAETFCQPPLGIGRRTSFETLRRVKGRAPSSGPEFKAAWGGLHMRDLLCVIYNA